MATEQLNSNGVFTKPSNGDLSGSQFYAVMINSSGNMVVASALGQRVLGIQQNKPNAAGLPLAYASAGITKAVASAAISAGALVTTAADGRVVTAASTHFILGIAVSAAGAANDVLEVQLLPGSAAVP